MRKKSFLHYATRIWLFLTVLLGGYIFYWSTFSSEEVVSASPSTIHQVLVEDFEPGQISTFWLGESPITVWRRDFDQKVQSLQQIGLAENPGESLLEEIRSTEEVEIEPGQVLRFEWFVASPINIGGIGCVTLPQSGAYDGFFDPCQSVHFDLWGQARRGPTETDLFVPPWAFSDDRRFIIIDVRDAPQTRRL